MIDLCQFCWKGVGRDYLRAPYSVGEWTYATNGHIAVRVPRRPDVGENSKAPQKIAELFEAAATQPLRDLPQFPLPETEKEECPHCEGRGTEHGCPNCHCQCESCDGTGTREEDASVGIGGRCYALRYVRRLLLLPHLSVASAPPSTTAMRFAFDGGEGILVPLRTPYSTHVDAPLC